MQSNEMSFVWSMIAIGIENEWKKKSCINCRSGPSLRNFHSEKTSKYAVIIIKTVNREHKIAFQFLFFYLFSFANEFSIEPIFHFICAARVFLFFDVCYVGEWVWVCVRVQIIKNYVFFPPFTFFACRIEPVHSFVPCIEFEARFSRRLFSVPCALAACQHTRPLDDLCFSRQVLIRFFFPAVYNSSHLIMFTVRFSSYFCVSILCWFKFFSRCVFWSHRNWAADFY